MSDRLFLALSVIVAVFLVWFGNAKAATLQFGAQDDAHLTASYRPGTLESMRSRGIQAVRFIVFQDRDDRHTQESIQRATALGFQVQVVLSAGREVGPYRVPRDYVQWAAMKTRYLQILGVRTVSILNEPDIFLDVGDRCNTLAKVKRTLRRNKSALRRQVGWKKTRVRLKGRIAIVRRRVVRRVVSSISDVNYTADAACTRIWRAKYAVEVYRRAIPAIRRAAPGIRVLIGETSPTTGVRTFVAAVRQMSYPRADGFAHHPYYGAEGGYNTGRLKAREPIHWTEFGTPVRTHGWAETLQTARARWTAAVKAARRQKVRQIVAYGWWTTRKDWDTAAEGVLF